MTNTEISTEKMIYLENLVKVRLSDEKREKYRIEIDKILEYVKEITSIDLGDVKADHTHRNIFKNDEVSQNIDHTKKALDNAPDKVGNLYRVSQVIKQ